MLQFFAELANDTQNIANGVVNRSRHVLAQMTATPRDSEESVGAALIVMGLVALVGGGLHAGSHEAQHTGYTRPETVSLIGGGGMVCLGVIVAWRAMYCRRNPAPRAAIQQDLEQPLIVNN